MTSVTVHLSKIVMLQKTKKDDVNVILLQIKEHQYKHILSKKKKKKNQTFQHKQPVTF